MIQYNIEANKLLNDLYKYIDELEEVKEYVRRRRIYIEDGKWIPLSKIDYIAERIKHDIALSNYKIHFDSSYDKEVQNILVRLNKEKGESVEQLISRVENIVDKLSIKEMYLLLCYSLTSKEEDLIEEMIFNGSLVSIVCRLFERL